MADERFNDWSPASVFGATAREPAAPLAKRPSLREPHVLLSSSSPLDDRTHGASPPPLPPRRRNTDTSASHRENRAGSSTSDGEKVHIRVTRGPKRHDGRIQATGPQLAEIASAYNHNNQVRLDTSQLALVVMQVEEEQDRAARVLQKHGRMLLLVKREHKTLREVQALRFMLQKAAVSQLVHFYRQYCARHAIEAYLSRWREQEFRIQRLLHHAQVTKCALEARVIALKAQRHQQQRERASLLIVQWCTMRIRLRRLCEVRHPAQRRVGCWYRRIKTELRCHERVNVAWRSRAAQRIQRAYRRLRHTRGQDLERRQRASRTITEWIQRRSIQRKNIQLILRRRLVFQRGAQLIAVATHKRVLRHAYQRWLAVSNHLQQLLNASSRRLQTATRAFVARKKQTRRCESAIRIQRLARGRQARAKCVILHQQKRKLAKNKHKQHAATVIQARFRGFRARQCVAKLLKQLRDRFRCSNCGMIEPSGVYCKLCGRKRTNFDLSPAAKRALLLDIGASSCEKRPDDGFRQQVLPLHLAPVRPASPPSFPKLQTGKNVKLRMQMARRPPLMHTATTSSNQQEGAATSLEVAALSSLPMVLSPRHIALDGGATPAKRPLNSSRPPLKLSDGNQAKQFAFPSRPQPKAVLQQTKLRAQALVHLQIQQQRLNHSQPALTQHLHRLQKASRVINRSR